MGVYKGYKQTEDHKIRRATSRIDNAFRRSGGLTREERRKNPPELIKFGGMRARAKGRFPFSLTLKEFREFYYQTSHVCAYCDIVISHKNSDRNKTLSIDRKYNEIGYVKDNLCFACYRCNTIKGNTFTFEQMR